MFDVGNIKANPEKDWLSLNMIDSVTHPLVKQHFFSRKENRQTSQIEFIKNQLSNVYTNMLVNSLKIEFDENESLPIGKKTKDDGKAILMIDGECVTSIFNQENLEVKSIKVSRVMKQDGEQVSVPVMTYFPLKDGRLVN